MINVKIEDLIIRLTKFDIEGQYEKITEDIREKYHIAADYYRHIEAIRASRISDGLGNHQEETAMKKSLVVDLDVIVTTLRKSFDNFIAEKYSLLDQLFVAIIHDTAEDENQEADYEDQVRHILQEQPVLVYAEEFEKIRQIFAVLDAEFQRLHHLKDSNKF